jgi:two-component system sensor histidine kinase KdpD
MLIGASRRSRWTELVRGSVVNRIAQEAGGGLDVHIISTAPPSPPAETPGASRRHGRRPAPSPLPVRRRLLGAAVAVVGLPLLTAALVPLHERLGFTTVGFCYLLAVVLIGALGGRLVGIAGAVLAFFLTNWFFADPVHTFAIANERDAIALSVFLAVAAVVSVLVERVARRSADAARARREAEALATMAGLLVRVDDPLPDLLGVLVATFDLDGVAVVRATADGWVVEAAAGSSPPDDTEDATEALVVGEAARLLVRGDRLGADDRRVIGIFATHLALALESRRLRAEAAQAAAVSRAGEVRDAILAAVSHDLRTPLTTIKTAASSLLDPDLALDEASEHELVATIDEESDRLNGLVGNLLDLGRLRADALSIQNQPTHLADVVVAALKATPHEHKVVVDLPDELPAVVADPVLLERALANLLANAFRYSPTDRAVTVRAAPGGDDTMELRIADRGPGISRAQRSRVFQPFQRLDDSPESAGVGLGLTVARDFVKAMDGRLEIDETPGGGTTMVVILPRAPAPASNGGTT